MEFTVEPPIEEEQRGCPKHSHYVICGSPCPYSCVDIRPLCTYNKQYCIGTCQCDDTYVQVSPTNVTCVPAAQCRGLNIDRETKICINFNFFFPGCDGLKCSENMICIDGY